MRFLPALFLIAAPLFAQGASDEEQRRAEERRIEEARRAEAELAAQEALCAARESLDVAEKEQYDKRAEELRRLAEERSKWGMASDDIKRLLEDLKSKSGATREAAMEELKRVNAKLDELLPIIADVLARTERARVAVTEFGAAHAVEPRTLYLGALGGEAISGAADGTEYSLKSLGGGKYQLAATKRDGDGKVMEQIEDAGTMAELQAKYGFLAAGLAVQLKAQAAGMLAAPAAVPLQPGRNRFWSVNTQGVVQSVEWDGGGRVGVSVCPPSEDLRFHLQLPEGAGYIVQQVVPGSRAEQIGIRRMDVLLRLDGELIDSPLQLKKLHEKAGVLEILRRSEAKKIDLATIAEEAPAQPEKEKAPEGAR